MVTGLYDLHTILRARQWRIAMRPDMIVSMKLTSHLSVLLFPAALLAQTPTLIDLSGGQIVFEYTGQVTNIGTASIQVGYFNAVKGVNNVFSGSPQDETKALFTFYTSVTTTRNVLNGTVRSIDRDGATMVYLGKGPADFSSLDSFRTGTPIQASSIHQHVVIDTVTSGFTVTNFNEVSSASPFTLNGDSYQLGTPGQTYRTNLTGHLTTTSPPSGYFVGVAIGTEDSLPFLDASPNPAKATDSTGLVQIMLTWGAPGVASTEIHVGAPDGQLMVTGGPSGSAATAVWVSNGTKFYLQDVSGGKALNAANTLAQVTAIVQ